MTYLTLYATTVLITSTMRRRTCSSCPLSHHDGSLSPSSVDSNFHTSVSTRSPPISSPSKTEDEGIGKISGCWSAARFTIVCTQGGGDVLGSHQIRRHEALGHHQLSRRKMSGQTQRPSYASCHRHHFRLLFHPAVFFHVVPGYGVSFHHFSRFPFLPLRYFLTSSVVTNDYFTPFSPSPLG